MKPVIATLIAALSLATAARAADLSPAYTKAPVVAPAYNWSGFYAGAFGGYGWADARSSNYFVDDLSGGFGGGTVGFNWQIKQFLLGIEAEGAWADIRTNAATPFISGQKVDAFGSVTGRVGWAANDWLFYAKGGYGWLEGKGNLTTITGLHGDTRTHEGYVIGGGIEWGFARNWSAKAEYLLYHADNQNYFLSIIPAGGVPSGSFDVQTVKFGINYHFDWGRTPIIAKY